MNCSWRHEHLCPEWQAWRQVPRCVVSSTLSSQHGDEPQLRPEKWRSVCTSWGPQRASAGRCYALRTNSRCGSWTLRLKRFSKTSRLINGRAGMQTLREKGHPVLMNASRVWWLKVWASCQQMGAWVPAQGRTSCVLLCQLINPSVPCMFSGTIKATRTCITGLLRSSKEVPHTHT